MFAAEQLNDWRNDPASTLSTPHDTRQEDDQVWEGRGRGEDATG